MTWPISSLMAQSTNNIVAIWVCQILVWFRKRNYKYILKNRPFGADWGTAASSSLISFEIKYTITINNARYNTMLYDFFPPEFDEIDADNLYFQKNSAPLHVSRLNMNTLRAKFGDTLISRDSPVNQLQDHAIERFQIIFTGGMYVKRQSTSNARGARRQH